MRVETVKIVCDNCDRISEKNSYEEGPIDINWIEVKKIGKVADENLIFCSEKCLIKYFKEQPNE